MLRFLRHGAKRFVDDDSGVAMITVIGIIGLMTIVVMAAFALSQQATTDSVRTKNESQSFQAANAGIDAALSRLQARNYQASDYPLTGTTVSGSYTATISTGASSDYVCVATGVDSSGHRETIRVNFSYLDLWNMNMGLSGGASGKIKGNSSFWGPLYVVGDFSIGNSAQGGYAHGPLFIKNGNFLGGNIVDDIALYIKPGYTYVADPKIVSVSRVVPDISLPPIDAAYLAEKWSLARSESIDNLLGTDSGSAAAVVETTRAGDPTSYPRTEAPGHSSYYKLVANSAATAPSAVDAGTNGLTITGSQSWGLYSGGHDDFAFDASNGILYVEGTVFVDGPLVVDTPIEYVGNGALVCNGDIHLNKTWVANTTTATATIRPGYMDANHAVGLVTPGDIYVAGVNGNPKGEFENPSACGAFFATGTFYSLGKGVYKGAIHTGTIDCGGNNNDYVTDPLLSTYVPGAMPGAGQAYLIRDSWTRQ